MKILAFTAGAAKMYCGSCLRDNALAAELKRQGHDVVLLPLYTPTRTDESNVSEPVVLMNGISVCLDQQAAFFRKTHRLLDRLWDAPWMLKLASKTSIEVDPHMLGGMTVSMLRGEDGFQLKEIRKLSAWLRHEAPPDVVTLPNSLLIGLARPVRDALHRPVCCTLQGEELFLSQLQEPYRTQAMELIRAKIHDVDGFVAVSHYSAGYWIRELGIAENQMHVVPLGISLGGYRAAESAPHQPFRVGFLARVAPEKGLHVLAESYIRLRRETDFSGAVLEAAGYLAPEHRAYLRGVERLMKDAGFGEEFHYRGELDRVKKIEFLNSLDLLSVPCVYDEPKGIFLLEAMASGVPVVQPRRGAFPEILAHTGGGVLVEPEPDDSASLADAIHRLWKSPAERAELGRRGAEGVRAHYSVSQMAERALEAYGKIVAAVAHA
jgi:glycosyltransferase involved in cell wall biosynthesis